MPPIAAWRSETETASNPRSRNSVIAARSAVSRSKPRGRPGFLGERVSDAIL
jgi:hypothetical protein